MTRLVPPNQLTFSAKVHKNHSIFNEKDIYRIKYENNDFHFESRRCQIFNSS